MKLRPKPNKIKPKKGAYHHSELAGISADKVRAVSDKKVPGFQ